MHASKGNNSCHVVFSVFLQFNHVSKGYWKMKKVERVYKLYICVVKAASSEKVLTTPPVCVCVCVCVPGVTVLHLDYLIKRLAFVM